MNRTCRLFVWLPACLLLWTGCSVTLDPVECARQADCLQGLACLEGVCQVVSEDGGADGGGGDVGGDVSQDAPPDDTTGDVGQDGPEDTYGGGDLAADGDGQDVGRGDDADTGGGCGDCAGACVSQLAEQCAGIAPRCVPEEITRTLTVDERQVEMPMRLIPQGTFVYGQDGGFPQDGPPHLAFNGAFYMMVNEVAWPQYHTCIQAGLCPDGQHTPGLTNNGCTFGLRETTTPMNCVMQPGAAAFCGAIGGRLPTEAEWERAARGVCASSTCLTGERGEVRDNRRYPWGDDDPDCGRVCAAVVCHDQSRLCEIGPELRPRGASQEGILDMAGSVAEWTSDNLDEGLHSEDALLSCPTYNDTSEFFVVRGGGFSALNDSELSVSRREEVTAASSATDIGFRCVFDVASL